MFPLTCFGMEKHIKIDVFNSTDSTRTSIPVVVSLKKIDGLDFEVHSVSIYDDNIKIPYQLDDLDCDGRYDEFCFLCVLPAHNHKTYKAILSDSKETTVYNSGVYADMMLDDKKGAHPLITCLEAPGNSSLYNDLYHHGVAFESELTAYRIYFDHRQNIDIYGKRFQQLELKDTGFYTSDSQMAEGYGNDVLWAGNSIGCGSLKLWDGKEFQNWTDLVSRGQRIISSGPLRTIVKITDIGVKIPGTGETCDVATIYTQYAGHREVQVDIYLSRPIDYPFLCTGVQKIGASAEAESYNGMVKAEGFVNGDGIAASWGSDYPEMGKKNQFPPEAVGLAVYVDKQYVSSTQTDDLNYIIVIGKKGQQHIRYYVSFCADKEKYGYHSAKAWFDSLEGLKYINQESQEIIIKEP